MLARWIGSAILLLLAGCSVVSLDLTPPIRPLQETTVEGQGDAKVLLLDISGILSDEAVTPVFTLGSPPARVPLLVRIREELKKAQEDRRVRALVVRINSPGGTVTASDIVYRELQLFRERAKIPLVAALMDVAASGGYYVALAVRAAVSLGWLATVCWLARLDERAFLRQPALSLTRRAGIPWAPSYRLKLALWHLVHGRLQAALRSNPLVFAVGYLACGLTWQTGRSLVRHRQDRVRPSPLTAPLTAPLSHPSLIPPSFETA